MALPLKIAQQKIDDDDERDERKVAK